MNARLAAAALAAVTLSAAVHAATIDMNDPLRSVGREDDIRIDAQLQSDTVSPGAPVVITWQIQNFTDITIAVATREVDASYDSESRTITLTVGSEVPDGGKMPVMVLVAPGEKKVFRAAATPALSPAVTRHGDTPRYVQVKVSILRDLQAFMPLIEKQTAKSQDLSDALFDQWFEATDTILLNTLPVQWSARARMVDVEQRSARF